MPKRRPRSFSTEDFEVKESSIPGIGFGLFARKTIYKGDTIGPYSGEIVTDEEANEEPYVNSLYLLWICKDHWVVGEGKGSSYTGYINHSDNPNTRFVVSTRWKKARVEATKRICCGEEVFIDYGPEYWEAMEIEKQ